MKVWVAEFSDGYGPGKFALFVHREDAMVQAANWMTAEYKQEGDACEGDDVTEFRTIDNYGDTPGLTKIIWVTDGFFPGAPDASVYEKEIVSRPLICPVEMLNCDLGLYQVYWKSGGSSFAAVGNHHNGDRWLAPTNWTCKSGQNPGTLLKDYLTEIERMEKIV